MRRDNGQKSYALAMLDVAVLMGPRKGASVGAAFDLPRENLYARKLWLLSLYPCLHPPAVSFTAAHTTKLSKTRRYSSVTLLNYGYTYGTIT